jgi:hypothetical protein
MWASSSRALPAGLLLVAAVGMAGCFTYEPIMTAERPAPGHDVRIRYEDPDAGEPQPWQRRGPGSTSVQGKVIEWGEDVAVLGVIPPPAMGMSRASPHPDTVRVPVRGIVLVERRELDVVRTSALGVAGAIGGVVLTRALIQWTRRATPPSSGGP